MKYLEFLVLTVLIASCTVSNFDRGYLIPAQNEPVELSFETEKDLITIEAEINGVPGHFLFDNGFSLSAVNKDFAEKAKISFKGNTNIVDANNKKTNTKETTVDTVRIKGQTFVNTGFYQIDTKKFLPCAQIDGVIGASIINKINWKIDFQNRSISISSIPFDNQGLGIKLLYGSNNSAFINVSIKDKTIKSKLDFGLSGELKLDYEDASELFQNKEVEKRIGITSFSATGMSNISSFHKIADKVEIEYNNKPLPYKGKIRLSKDMKYDGYIGIEYFDNYLVILNSTEKQLCLITNDTNTTSAHTEKSYGLALYPIEGKWKIIQLNPNEPLLDETLLMQEISLLDNEPINRFDLCEYERYMRKKFENQEALSITIKNTNKPIELAYKEPALTTLE